MTFSQIIITYNSSEHIRRCLDSVLNQSILPDEIIIGDDFSKDNTRDILKKYEKKYPNLIRLIFHEENLGISGNLNACAKVASGKYISFLAGDDWLLPGKNEVQFNVISREGEKYGLYFSDFLIINVKENKKRVRSNLKKEGNYFKWICRRLFSIRTFWLRRDLFFKVGGFDNELCIYEDWHFKLKLSLIADFKKIPGVYSVYQVHDEGIHNVHRKVHIENMNTIVEILAKDGVKDGNLKKIKASIARTTNNTPLSLNLDPLFFFYKIPFRLYNAVKTFKHIYLN